MINSYIPKKNVGAIAFSDRAGRALRRHFVIITVFFHPYNSKYHVDNIFIL